MKRQANKIIFKKRFGIYPPPIYIRNEQKIQTQSHGHENSRT